MRKNENNVNEYTDEECIKALQRLIDSNSIEQKRAVDIHAMDRAAQVLEAEHANPHVIATLGYHASHDLANVYPDSTTKQILRIGLDALVRKRAGTA